MYSGKTARRRARWAAVALIGGAVAVGTAPAAQAAPATLHTQNARSSAGPVVAAADTPYQYAPSVIKDGGTYRMWWCSTSPAGTAGGDDILYAEASNPDGPFHAHGSDKPYQIVFQNDGSNGWDGQHVCDPSVVRVGDHYLMYYSGAPNDHGQQQGSETSIGVAQSADGISWHPLSDQPIIGPAHQRDNHNNYGAGQPSAVYRDGQIYLLFTDTTAAGDNPANGAGQFAYRSADPAFASGVQVATKDGWQARTSANDRQFSVAEAFTSDWQYSDTLQSFVLAHNNDPGRTTLSFLSPSSPATRTYQDVSFASQWTEGPGLVSTPDKHAIAGPACTTVPVDVVQSTGKTNNAPATLKHFGVDVVSDQDCASPSPSATTTDSPQPSHSAAPTHAPSHSPSDPASSTPAAAGHGGGGALPVTGTSLTVFVIAGLALIAAGIVLFVLARRRRAGLSRP